ncbi:MAG: hypothetical protein ACXVA0_24980, partial [Mucilaginibacter sp.]
YQIRVVEVIDSNTDNVIHDIVQNFPENEWLSRIHEALPGVDDGYIMSTIEIFFDGDVSVVEEDGSEHGLLVL